MRMAHTEDCIRTPEGTLDEARVSVNDRNVYEMIQGICVGWIYSATVVLLR
jgi:hypothetical protein